SPAASGAAMATGPRLDYQADGTPGVYRVEATLPVRRGGGPLAPWLVSNPIHGGAGVPVGGGRGPVAPWARSQSDLRGAGVAVRGASHAAGDRVARAVRRRRLAAR